jgi:sugar transferase (PEP-CTERM/EpsH1 system associated)
MVKPLYGETLRAYQILTRLAEKHDVTLLCFDRNGHRPGDVQLQLGSMSSVRLVPFKRTAATLKSVLSLPAGTPAQVAFLSSGAMRRAVRETCDSFKPDLLFVHMARMAQYARGLGEIPVILDLVDSFSLHVGSYAGLGAMRSPSLMRIETKKMAKYECKCVARAALSFAASRRDVEAVRNSPHYEGGRIEVLPNGVDTDYFKPKEVARDNSIVFVGNLGYPPNEDAALWFANDIFPLVLERVPSARFVVVGMNPPPKVRALADRPQVDVTGEVPDVRPYLWRAAVSVAPLRKAGGSQFKVLEAMACGIPSVVTSAAAEGFDAEPGEGFEVADGLDAFAARISRLLESSDRRHDLAAAGRKVVLDKYSWPGIVSNLEKMLASL